MNLRPISIDGPCSERPGACDGTLSSPGCPTRASTRVWGRPRRGPRLRGRALPRAAAAPALRAGAIAAYRDRWRIIGSAVWATRRCQLYPPSGPSEPSTACRARMRDIGRHRAAPCPERGAGLWCRGRASSQYLMRNDAGYGLASSKPGLGNADIIGVLASGYYVELFCV